MFPIKGFLGLVSCLSIIQIHMNSANAEGSWTLVSPGTLKNLNEACEEGFKNCTTRSDYLIYNCQEGELVKTSDNCNTTADLHCINEVCVPNCVPAEALDYDYVKMECVARFGYPCSATRKCQESTAICEFRGDERRLSSRRCVCPQGTQDVNGTCTRLVVYGKECGSPSVPLPQRNCDVVSSIHCSNGTCQCSTAGQTFVEKYNRCLSFEGQPCDPYLRPKHCTPMAFCSDARRKCVCFNEDNDDPKWSASLGKKYCLPYLPGSICDLNDDFLRCDPLTGLECTNGTCNCNEDRIFSRIYYGSSWTQTNKLHECWIKAGSPCNKMVSELTTSTNGNSCVPNAVCLNRECRCKKGYSQTINGFCAGSEGQACIHTGHRNAYECNWDHGLTCVNGRCGCSDLHFKFNALTLSCEDSFEIKVVTESSIIANAGQQRITNQGSGNTSSILVVLVLFALLLLIFVFIYVIKIVRTK